MVLIIAHRGFRARYPENTMLAFQKAIEAKSDGIELDVHKTKDGKIVVMHDGKVDRTTNGRGKIVDMTYKEMQKLDAGKGEVPPLLDDVVGLCKEAQILLNIEVKARGLEEDLVALLEAEEFIDHAIISSFKHDVLKNIRNLNPNLKIAALVPHKTLQFAIYTAIQGLNFKQKGLVSAAKKIDADAINPFYGTCTRNFFKYALDNGLEIYPWTVDSPKVAQKFAKYGTSGIITNNPERLLEVLPKEN